MKTYPKYFNKEIPPSYVTLEQAKLLPSIGFNLKCENFFNKGSGFRLQSDSLIRTGSDIIYEAPTQWELIEWLRVKHEIHFKYEPTINDKYDGFVYRMGWQYVGTYNSPQEAYSAAFDCVLKNNLVKL